MTGIDRGLRRTASSGFGRGVRFLEEEAPCALAPASHKSVSLKAGNGADLARSSSPLASLPPSPGFFPRGQRSSSVGRLRGVEAAGICDFARDCESAVVVVRSLAVSVLEGRGRRPRLMQNRGCSSGAASVSLVTLVAGGNTGESERGGRIVCTEHPRTSHFPPDDATC